MASDYIICSSVVLNLVKRHFIQMLYVLFVGKYD